MNKTDWHARYTQQANWTRPLREHLLNRAGLGQAGRILEVGCGTGAILAGMPATAQVAGLDIDREALRLAGGSAPAAALSQADAHSLPFASGVFGIVCCHYLLLWLDEPLTALREMTRLCKPGGWVLALAEPDYGGRIDHPAELAVLGRWQADSLRGQGAEPEMGRRLAGLFRQAGLKDVETGVMAGAWTASALAETGLEWEVLAADLAGNVSGADLQEMREIDLQARQRGERVLFVPTFYALGRAG
jgi:SAM-dependent methyltransferase